MDDRKSAAIVGGGVIGGGWAARFALHGWEVSVFDPGPQAESVQATIDRARTFYPALYDGLLPPMGRVRFATDLAGAVRNASWIQESVPEQLEVKLATIGRIQDHCPADAVIASSTSGFKPSDLQQGSSHPGQIVVAHPFNPVYLLPVVELVLSGASDPGLADRAEAKLRQIGMHPLRVRAEIDAHIGDRLLEAVWREALWLIRDDIATTGEIDEVITLGFGLRWAQMGLFETYRIAGGPQGMEHFIRQFGPHLKAPWTRLTDVPDLDDALAARIGRQSDRQSGSHSIGQLEEIRDANLVTMLRGLKSRNWGAGRFLRDCEARVATRPDRGLDCCPMTTIERIIPPDWIDYNGHMNEARYLEIFSLATDSFLEAIGCDSAYVESGRSYFTLETHIRHIGEAFAGDRVSVETCCLLGEGRKLHLMHRLSSAAGDPLATGEHLLIHIDLAARRSSEPEAGVAVALADISHIHAAAGGPEWTEPQLSFRRKGSRE